MPRTTEDKVREVIDTDPDINVIPMMTFAGTLTDRVSTCATAKGVTLTAAELVLIETYLAAHLYALNDQQAIEKTANRSEVKYMGKTGMRLESTYWGQTAMIMDHSGCLSDMNSGNKFVTGSWLGTERTTT